ncbi:MAG: aminomethyl-transferring glycine dehydrogenase subunit GcvPB [Candidatus Eisenbacteria bacterium]|uniref:Probable glycine dehydrogenase (decarboxylating) subunit 2 n=1 Tax=Eiseniibacteriota bacterium TaxID=2212470 RepID=A0A9D6QPY9_UNCEI|nr:aminomethyl-transferring glycine dehydrogenase subunit GcvPB [Candidatus Eisenbacteria bacterium]MBI3540384.1 aminomethyl-transferring glycine dehydrogenase subunit GcvPB [Candidatus Eisenbacteria bacterium]
MPRRLLIEQGGPGHRGPALPRCDVPTRPVTEHLRGARLRAELRLPEVSEPEVVRHFVELSTLNHHIDRGLYPLGSCTMKHNPKINDEIAGLAGFALAHPLGDDAANQGALRVIRELEKALAAISGFAAVSTQPAAGAQGEMTGLLMIRAHHRARGEGETRRRVIVPDSAHGTNPASVHLVGYETVVIPSEAHATVDLDALRGALDERAAAVMLTVPNTLGLFEPRIREITALAHAAGAQVYMDGANMNALVGLVRPGDLGFDVMHINLHKTFSTPHGGGGPGAGPVAVAAHLEPYLPAPRVVERDGRYALDEDRPRSIGRVHSFHGNFGILLRALVYVSTLGPEGLRAVSRTAILNANYLMRRLAGRYDLPHPEHCMHEFVLSGRGLKRHGVKTLDVAKRLLDFGVHAPTVYFPLIVDEALMIEPTETETLDRLDHFAAAMERIADEAAANPQTLLDAPHTTPVGRLDEARAARELKLHWASSGAARPAAAPASARG